MAMVPRKAPVAHLQPQDLVIRSEEVSDLYKFLRVECESSWYPSFKHGIIVFRNIGSSLLVVGSDDVASVKVFCVSGEVDEFNLLKPGLTIRTAIETCRTNALDAAIALQLGMDNIAMHARNLHGDNEKLARLTSALMKKHKSDDVVKLVEEAEKLHQEIIDQQEDITVRWQRLKNYVCQLKGALNDQLQRVEDQGEVLISEKTAVEERMASERTNIKRQKAQALEQEKKLRRIKDKYQSLVDEYREIKSALRSLKDEKEEKESDRNVLVGEMEEDKEYYEEGAKDDRTCRMEWDQEASEMGFAVPSIHYYWNGEEKNRREQWREKVKEYKASRVDGAGNKVSLGRSIRELSRQITKYEVRKRQLEDGRINEALRELERIQESSASSVSLRSVDDSWDEIERLQKELDSKERSIELLTKYHSFVPALCVHLGEAATSLAYMYNAYAHISGKLKSYKSIYATAKEAAQGKVRGMNMKDGLLQDITCLRLTYVVIYYMAMKSSTVSRELYQEALHIISSLGVTPSQDSIAVHRSTRGIRLDSAENAHGDLDELYRKGSLVAKNLDEVLKDPYKALSQVSQDIARRWPLVWRGQSWDWAFLSPGPTPGSAAGQLP